MLPKLTLLTIFLFAFSPVQAQEQPAVARPER